MRELLNALGARDAVAVFIDDATVTRDQVPALPSSCDTWTAIAFAPGGYHPFHQRVRARMRALVESGRELHATEIVNPTKKSPWNAYSIPHRRRVLEEYGVELLRGPRRVYFCVSRHDEYADGVPRLTFNACPTWAGLGKPKEGGWFLTLNVLIKRLRHDFPGSKFVLVSDAGRFSNISHQILEPNSGFYGDGVFYLDSHAMPGTQFADLAAYVHARNTHRYQRSVKGEKPGPFDDIVGRIVLGLKTRRVDLNVLHEVFATATPIPDTAAPTPS